jgi:hypothetical protein
MRYQQLFIKWEQTGIKTQMGTTLSSCSHFVAQELLPLWRQATVIMIGCIFISLVPPHSVDNFSSPSLSGSAFYSITFRLSLQFSFRSTFPDGVSLNTTWFFTLDQFFCCMEYSGFSAFVLPGIIKETYAPSFSRSSTQLSNERPALPRLTEQSDCSFCPNSDSSAVQTLRSE